MSLNCPYNWSYLPFFWHVYIWSTGSTVQSKYRRTQFGVFSTIWGFPYDSIRSPLDSSIKKIKQSDAVEWGHTFRHNKWWTWRGVCEFTLQQTRCKRICGVGSQAYQEVYLTIWTFYSINFLILCLQNGLKLLNLMGLKYGTMTYISFPKQKQAFLKVKRIWGKYKPFCILYSVLTICVLFVLKHC